MFVFAELRAMSESLDMHAFSQLQNCGIYKEGKGEKRSREKLKGKAEGGK